MRIDKVAPRLIQTATYDSAKIMYSLWRRLITATCGSTGGEKSTHCGHNVGPSPLTWQRVSVIPQGACLAATGAN